jgi:hypothetical protein
MTCAKIAVAVIAAAVSSAMAGACYDLTPVPPAEPAAAADASCPLDPTADGCAVEEDLDAGGVDASVDAELEDGGPG